MDKDIRISAVIITFNEERNIARCLDSLVGVADEIIVVDSFSKDATESICKEKGVRFMQNEFKGHIEQKNFAMQQAKGEYVLSLDADEALDDRLRKSILAEKANLTKDGYRFNRLTNYCGQWIKHCGWYPDTKLRLWKVGKGKWGGENPHDKVILEPDASVQHLDGDLYHYSFYSIKDHLKQIDYFTDISSKAAYDKGKRSNLLKMIVKPMFKFFQSFIMFGGFRDGFYGYVICRNSAYAKYLKYLKLYELGRK